jgi:hypothetical protein
MAKKVPGLYRRGNIWWAKYYVNGAPVRESTGTAKITEAEQWLALRKGAKAERRPILPRGDKVLYDEIAADLRTHYKTTG